MSYSINVRGKTKHEVTQKAHAALAQQLAQMSDHARDAAGAHASIASHIAAANEPKDGAEIVVEANGSISGHWDQGVMQHATGVSHTVRVYHAPAATTP